ncbi:MAG TPA: 50S ribosomal protein L32e [Hadesarchaea archaeon]|nr:50S ribosomal protein L32e [Hadesarchaea archaeon]
MTKKKSLKFRRQEWFRFKKLSEKWRKPRGRDSKMRLGMSGKPAVVSIGYRSSRATRHVHPSGLVEVLVNNPRDLEDVDPSGRAVRISSKVGKKTREQIMAKAKDLKIKVLNPGVKKRGTERKEETGS